MPGVSWTIMSEWYIIAVYFFVMSVISFDIDFFLFWLFIVLSIISYCIVLNCIELYCIVLYCILFYCILFYFITSFLSSQHLFLTICSHSMNYLSYLICYFQFYLILYYLILLHIICLWRSFMPIFDIWQISLILKNCKKSTSEIKSCMRMNFRFHLHFFNFLRSFCFSFFLLTFHNSNTFDLSLFSKEIFYRVLRLHIIFFL